MIVTALMYPLWLSPALSSALAKCFWYEVISRSGSPFRSFGMKCQFSRSALSNAKVHLSRCSELSDDRKRFAVSTMSEAVPVFRGMEAES
jgi:hypothetical protein